jgi:hypothetical protein
LRPPSPRMRFSSVRPPRARAPRSIDSDAAEASAHCRYVRRGDLRVGLQSVTRGVQSFPGADGEVAAPALQLQQAWHWVSPIGAAAAAAKRRAPPRIGSSIPLPRRRELRAKLARCQRFPRTSETRSARHADDPAPQILPSSSSQSGRSQRPLSYSPRHSPRPERRMETRAMLLVKGRPGITPGTAIQGCRSASSSSCMALHQRRTQSATTEGQTAGPGLASFFPSPGEGLGRARLCAETCRVSGGARRLLLPFSILSFSAIRAWQDGQRWTMPSQRSGLRSSRDLAGTF